MSDFDNNMRGSMFKNDRKESDRHPDYKGSAEIDGVEYWVSGWIKTAGPNAKTPGAKFFSLAFEAKNKTKEFNSPPARPHNPPVRPHNPPGDFDDDIAF